jgi:ribonuclease HI
MLATRLRLGYANMHYYMEPTGPRCMLKAAAGIVRQALRQQWTGSHQEASPNDGVAAYLLFFDGGSRGNPGPGEAGAVVVQLTSPEGAYRLVWAGSMSYAARGTTNNLAENMGLLTGLTACNEHGFSPLHVVGDSSMIIRQHVTRQPPKAKHLQPIYWRSRRQAAGIHILTWQHHLRAYNKMADMLANMAMDSLRSTQLHLGAEFLHTERDLH